MPANSMKVPIRLYKKAKTETMFSISCWSPSARGLYNVTAIAVPTPNSAIFRKPKRECRVDVSPTNSTPKQSMNIFREKKAMNTDINIKRILTRAFNMLFFTRDSAAIICPLEGV